jgi:hypothetical protein
MMTPMDEAWDLIKGQNIFSRMANRVRYGPVKYYHGTTSEGAKSIMDSGFEPRDSFRGVGAYVSQNPGFAANYATDFGQRPPEQQGMIGIRQKTPMPFQTTQGSDGYANQGRFTETIPSQYLVNMKPNSISNNSQQSVPPDYQEKTQVQGVNNKYGQWTQPMQYNEWLKQFGDGS